MNKAQKIVILCTLIIMFILTIYPPVAIMIPKEGKYSVHNRGRCIIFSFPTAPADYQLLQINTKKSIVELIAIAFLEGASVIFLA